MIETSWYQKVPRSTGASMDSDSSVKLILVSGGKKKGLDSNSPLEIKSGTELHIILQ